MSSSVLAVKSSPLPSVHEDHPLLDQPTRSLQQQAGIRAPVQSVQLPGPADDDLYPRPRPSASFTRFRLASMQTIPVTGLLRGQQGRLVPIQINAKLQLSPDPFEALASSSHGTFHDSNALKSRPLATPSSNEEMQELLRTHPEIESVTFEPEAKPDPLKLTEKYHAVQLRGQGLDARTLSTLKGKRLPFYVLGAKNKVWFFDTRDGKKYTYTDKMTSSDETFIRHFFSLQSQDVAESSQSAVQRVGGDAAESSHTVAHRDAGELAGEAQGFVLQTAVRQSRTITGVSLARQFAKGVRRFFREALRP